jgi:hypothetical protein
MSASLPRALLLAIGLVSAGAGGAEQRLTLLFTGDNGGEVAPCG